MHAICQHTGLSPHPCCPTPFPSVLLESLSYSLAPVYLENMSSFISLLLLQSPEQPLPYQSPSDVGKVTLRTAMISFETKGGQKNP